MKCLLLICVLGMAIAGSACDSSTPSIASPAPTSPTGTGSTGWSAERLKADLWSYDDPRCSDDERGAMQAAAVAVTDATKPVPNYARDYFFTTRHEPQGWDVSVWVLPPGATPVVGGYKSVQLAPDFTRLRQKATSGARSEWKEEYWLYEDPRCTEDERKAMRAAAAAASDPGKDHNFSRDFYFTIGRTASGWNLNVWEMPPGTIAAPGGFVAVYLSPDFKLIRIVGGA